MALSEEELNKRYGQFTGIVKIEKMIEDMVDTPIIMKEIRNYAGAAFTKGFDDVVSRSQSRPGFGDMGG